MIVGYSHSAELLDAWELDAKELDSFSLASKYTNILHDWTLYAASPNGKPHNFLVRSMQTKRRDKVREPHEPVYELFYLVADASDTSTWQVHVVNGVVDGRDLSPQLTGFESVYHYFGGPHEHFDEFVPEIELTGPETVPPDGWVELGLELEHGHDTTVYLEALSGYIPKTRITTVDRKATFKVCALGLEPGDKLRIKAGFKFYTGRGEAVLEIA